MEKDESFLPMLNFVLSREGGYVKNPNDKGGETNKGITHTTYDIYRKSKGLPVQSVKYITDYEVADIYYNDFYRASGADKLDNPIMAMYVFDTAVNMGVSTAKNLLSISNGDVEKFERLRREKYQKYVDYDKSQEIFLKGWNNRVDQLKNYAERNFPESKNAFFDVGIEMDVDQYGNVIDYYNLEDLKNMTPEIMKQNLKQILRQFINKILHPVNKYHNGNRVSCSGSYPVNGYTREDGTKVEGYT